MKKQFGFKLPKGILKSLLLKLTFISVCAVIFVSIAYYISRNTEYEYTKTEKTSASSMIAEPKKSTICNLVLENEKLVIYFPDGTKKYVQADTSALTDYDTRLLTGGICASREEIYEIIESLMS